MIAKLNDLNIGSDALIISNEVSENFYLAARNLPKVEVCDVAAVDPVSLIRVKKVLITLAAVKQLEELLK
jgi:large subunit ribosomal protein L4